MYCVYLLNGCDDCEELLGKMLTLDKAVWLIEEHIKCFDTEFEGFAMNENKFSDCVEYYASLNNEDRKRNVLCGEYNDMVFSIKYEEN